MFGLMRPEGGCSFKNSPDYTFHRMHYCGVCKTMGKTYGHKTRFLLNFDIVFLAELLTEWSSDDMSKWGSAYQAINQCFVMPKDQQPRSLQYAADAGLMLSELKIADQLEDNNSFRWRFAKWFFAGSFIKTRKNFSTKGVSENKIYELAAQQKKREETLAAQFSDLKSFINYYAEPTAFITAEVFKNGALYIERPDLAETASELGYQYGYLAYLLDAFEDVENDAFNGEFNPLLHFYNKEKTLLEAEREEVRQALFSIQESVSTHLKISGLTAKKVEMYQSRLKSALALKVYRDRQIPLTFKEKIEKRWSLAKHYAWQLSCNNADSMSGKLRYRMLSVAVFIAPKTVEHLGLENKEMTAFSWLTFLAAFFAALGLGFLVNNKVKSVRKEKKRKPFKFANLFKKAQNSSKCTNCTSGNNCGTCLTGCAGACACACCEGCCQSGCNSCTSGCCNGCLDNCSENKVWYWILLAFAVLAIGITILLVLLL